MTWVLDSTRIKQTFLRPTSDNGASAPLLATGFRRFCVTAVWGFLCLIAGVAEASFTPAPKEAVKALKITKGKPFSNGVVFINGKFIEPPYVVERYGNVLRINKIQITNAVIDWSEFLKTQDGAVTTKTAVVEESPAASEPAPEPVEATSISADDDDDPLADLFDDSPAPKKTARKQAAHHAPAKKPAAHKVKTTISLEGEFDLNAKAAMMVNKINAMRTEIDASLRRGCFFCFGSAYSRVSGDKAAAHKILQDVPKIMKVNSEFGPFAASIRKAGFVYFPPNLVKELFANRVDYLVMQKRWKKVFEELEFNSMLNKAGAAGY